MRKIYSNKTIGILEQGSVINGCVAREYPLNKDVFGIIITPRCDIANRKVSSVHYLPIVSLKDWLQVDFWNIFSFRLQNDFNSKLSNILGKYKMSSQILKVFSKEEILKTLKDILKPDDYKQFVMLYSKIDICTKTAKEVTQSEIDALITEFERLSISIFKELKENRFNEYYLIESWIDNSDDYFIVLMREIERVDYSLAIEITKGMYFSQLTEEQLKRNHLSCPVDEFLFSVAILNSPIIEHLIQHFFLNFGRIGIQDHPRELEKNLHKSCLNTNRL